VTSATLMLMASRCYEAGPQPTDIFGRSKMMSLVDVPNKYIRFQNFREGNCPIVPSGCGPAMRHAASWKVWHVKLCSWGWPTAKVTSKIGMVYLISSILEAWSLLSLAFPPVVAKYANKLLALRLKWRGIRDQSLCGNSSMPTVHMHF